MTHAAGTLDGDRYRDGCVVPGFLRQPGRCSAIPLPGRAASAETGCASKVRMSCSRRVMLFSSRNSRTVDACVQYVRVRPLSFRRMGRARCRMMRLFVPANWSEFAGCLLSAVRCQEPVTARRVHAHVWTSAACPSTSIVTAMRLAKLPHSQTHDDDEHDQQCSRHRPPVGSLPDFASGGGSRRIGRGHLLATRKVLATFADGDDGIVGEAGQVDQLSGRVEGDGVLDAQSPALVWIVQPRLD